MTHVAHQGRTTTPYATATTHPDPMGITSAMGGHKSRPRAAPHREIGGRQDRGSIDLWVLINTQTATEGDRTETGRQYGT